MPEFNFAVTGASGHIGNCLVRELIKRNTRVKVLVHNSENDLKKLDVDLFHGDVLNVDSTNEFCKNVDVLFHCAAIISIDNRYSKKVYDTNVTGTKNMVDAALSAGVKKFIHFSSIDAFRKTTPDEILDESIPVTSLTKPVYDFSKAISEKIVLDAVKKGLDAVILCPTAVIGPYDFRKSYLGQALIKIYKNKIPMLIPGGYNWVDVRDVVSAAIRAVDFGRRGEKYILSGHFSTISELSEIIGKISGKKTPHILAPVILALFVCHFYGLFYRITNQKPMFTCQSLKLLIYAPKNISNEKAKNELEYFPRPLEQTLADTLEWYKQNNHLV